MAEEIDPFDISSPAALERKAKQEAQGAIFSQKYLVFSGPSADPRAVELLSQWTKQVRRTALPKNATLQELAAANAIREFVEGLHSQIDIANQGLNNPAQSRTTK